MIVAWKVTVVNLFCFDLTFKALSGWKYGLTILPPLDLEASECLQRVQSLTSLPGISYLPGAEINRDHEGGFSRARPLHCTSEGLTSMIIPNVDNSGAQFLLVGSSVRADPDKIHNMINSSNNGK